MNTPFVPSLSRRPCPMTLSSLSRFRIIATSYYSDELTLAWVPPSIYKGRLEEYMRTQYR